MTTLIDNANGPEFQALLAHSDRILESIKKLKENPEGINWNEMKRLTDELAANSDKMAALIL